MRAELGAHVHLEHRVRSLLGWSLWQLIKALKQVEGRLRAWRLRRFVVHPSNEVDFIGHFAEVEWRRLTLWSIWRFSFVTSVLLTVYYHVFITESLALERLYSRFEQAIERLLASFVFFIVIHMVPDLTEIRELRWLGLLLLVVTVLIRLYHIF